MRSTIPPSEPPPDPRAVISSTRRTDFPACPPWRAHSAPIVHPPTHPFPAQGSVRSDPPPLGPAPPTTRTASPARRHTARRLVRQGVHSRVRTPRRPARDTDGNCAGLHQRRSLRRDRTRRRRPGAGAGGIRSRRTRPGCFRRRRSGSGRGRRRSRWSWRPGSSPRGLSAGYFAFLSFLSCLGFFTSFFGFLFPLPMASHPFERASAADSRAHTSAAAPADRGEITGPPRRLPRGGGGTPCWHREQNPEGTPPQRPEQWE